jgi:hypothetical protein
MIRTSETLNQALQPRLADALEKPQEPALHVCWKRGDFSGDSIVEDFNSPSLIRCAPFATGSLGGSKAVPQRPKSSGKVNEEDEFEDE